MNRIRLNSLRLNAVAINSAGGRWRGSHAGAPPVVPDVPDIPDIPEEPDVPSDPDVDENGYIIFADPEVKRVLLANGVGDGVGITKEAAAEVTSIGSWFYYNKQITSFDELCFFPNVKVLGGSTENGTFRESTLESIDLRHVTELGKRVFFKSNLSGVYDLRHITSIGEIALGWCNIRGVALNCANIVAGALAYNGVLGNCQNLEWVVCGANTLDIGTYAMRYCSSLVVVVVQASTPPTLGGMVWGNTPIASGTGSIYVPDTSVEAYKTATNWNSYASRIFPISQLATNNPELYAEIEEYL